MMLRTLFALLFTLFACSAQASNNAYDIGQLMAELATHKGGRALFVEKRYIAVLEKPVMASGEMARHYDKWFTQPIAPRNTSLNLPMSDALKALFANPNDEPLESYNK